MGERRTAAYKIVADPGGNRYRFYCDVSGAQVCLTKPYSADTPEKELMLAWETEGKRNFNLCHKCGKWVMNAVYNPEVLECTDCAPFEHETNYCKFCGSRLEKDVRFCPSCKKRIHYEGGGTS